MHSTLNRLIAGENLTAKEMHFLMESIMSGDVAPPLIAGLLVALRAKGETIEEIRAAVEVMRTLSLQVNTQIAQNTVDTCGTGGDGASTFNISTASAFVAAAGGAHIAKHGNRAVSGTCGSADVLLAAGAKLDLSAKTIGRAIDEVGFGFLYAPMHHAAMKHVMPVRRELGIRTLFNLLGPLTNPAGCKKQIIGLFDKHWLHPLAEVLRELGSKHVLLVHSHDGMDEISPYAPTDAVQLLHGEIRDLVIHPRELGVDQKSLTGYEAIRVDSPKDALAKFWAALKNENSDCACALSLNAGAALYIAGIAETIAKGAEQARQLLNDGAPIRKLEEYIAWTQAADSKQ